MRLAHQPRGEGIKGHGEKKAEMNPGQASGGSLHVVELRLLTHPKDPEGQEAQAIDNERRDEGCQNPQQVPLRVNRFGKRNMELQNQQSHSDAENAIAKSGEALDARSGDEVVGRAGQSRARLSR